MKQFKKVRYTPTQILKEPISIYDEELQVIKSCGGMKEQRLLFTLLCYSKASAITNNWVTTPARELFRSAGVSVSVADQNRMIYQLKNKGYLRNSKKIISNNIFVEVLPKEECQTEAFQLGDLRSLGVIYQAYLGGSIMSHKVLKYCKHCNIPFIDSTTKNNQMYCSQCKDRMRRQNIPIVIEEVSGENEKS